MGVNYSFDVKTIETHASTFLTLNILAIGRVKNDQFLFLFCRHDSPPRSPATRNYNDDKKHRRNHQSDSDSENDRHKKYKQKESNVEKHGKENVRDHHRHRSRDHHRR